MRPGLFGLPGIWVSASFVTPLFSTGVALATLAGGLQAEIVAAGIHRSKIENVKPDCCPGGYRNIFAGARRCGERVHGPTKEREFGFGEASEPVDPERRRTLSANPVSGPTGIPLMPDIQLAELVAEAETAEQKIAVTTTASRTNPYNSTARPQACPVGGQLIYGCGYGPFMGDDLRVILYVILRAIYMHHTYALAR